MNFQLSTFNWIEWLTISSRSKSKLLIEDRSKLSIFATRIGCSGYRSCTGWRRHLKVTTKNNIPSQIFLWTTETVTAIPLIPGRSTTARRLLLPSTIVVVVECPRTKRFGHIEQFVDVIAFDAKCNRSVSSLSPLEVADRRGMKGSGCRWLASTNSKWICPFCPTTDLDFAIYFYCLFLFP